MAVSSGVSISSITVASGVVTVNCSTSHGLAVNQGFSLQGTTSGTYNWNGTVTGVTGNSFTFAQSTLPGTGQAAPGGTAFPAKKIIILDIQPIGATDLNVRAALWLTTQNPLPLSSGSSQWTGASGQEVTAISKGYTKEMVLNKPFAVNGIAEGSVLAEWVNEYNSQQAALANAVQPGSFYGDYYDGVGWLF